ncbi:MAG: AbrB/MazE/SpoVT family DNA-binding domain-containing protein [Eubacteriales bacterium]|nr:AbrB/MazE/SpoVT family DNA-binding domain-containing protein [Eubacteriales bacterium]
MKATGIVRRIDQLGRIVLPAEVRKNFGLAEGDPVEIFTDKNTIILRKYNPACDYAEQIKPIRDNIAGDSSMDGDTKAAALTALNGLLKSLEG